VIDEPPHAEAVSELETYLPRSIAAGSGLVLLAGLAAVIGGAMSGAFAWVVIGCLLLVPFSVITVYAIRLSSLKSKLFDAYVTTPRPLAGWHIVRFTEITGVGMRYICAGRASGWRMFIWPQDGPPTRVFIPGPERIGPPRDFGRRVEPRTAWVPPLDWLEIYLTPAGDAAKQIYDRTIEVQGPDGLLATRQSQVTGSPSSGFETAFWSPDRRIGPLVAKKP
jgi:hypothetical protein